MTEWTTDVFCIDLDRSNPEILDFPAKEVQKDLDYFDCRHPADLSDYDRKIFLSIECAEIYLKKYLAVLKKLNNKAIKNSRGLPALLLKRRYLVQTIMGDKLQTYRHYKKDWKSGQLFNFYDQTYSITVKLISIENDSDGSYCYNYKLI